MRAERELPISYHLQGTSANVWQIAADYIRGGYMSLRPFTNSVFLDTHCAFLGSFLKSRKTFNF